ncbi:hypothetical protein [Sulfoacidibacillus ferrooxidans]|uniref:Uncharacterized protein n=1 Tax=Sulfoacidibacillus ferrooxidans TaxID=2005001 RepID=A0A9X1VAS2_9BACL|nr:hypothetical protein [Sulfoacidibacillus ferrooxidans]MCI0184816.1 hypothetical protein [Sulfoacidibacillus ferrooxidans]
MTEQSRDHDLQFLTERRHEIFNGKNQYLAILRGKIKVPTLTDTDDEFDEGVLSFGQFVAHKAQALGLTMRELSSVVQISMDDIIRIYDDVLFPWDLTPVILNKMAQRFNVPLSDFISVVRNHPLLDDSLRARLPQQTIAARTHHTLDANLRKNELIETQISIQRHREIRKRDAFILDLQRNN